MKCPKCQKDDDKVLESRKVRDGAAIRRRRECSFCGFRFTTYEEIDIDDVMVVKSDGRRECFQRSKLEKGIRTACQKRPVSDAQIRDLIDSVVVRIDGDEIRSSAIGEMVMERLHELDQVAYIRFASVYRRFTDAGQFGTLAAELGATAASEEVKEP